MIFRTLFSLFGVMTSFTLGLQAELPLTVSPIFQSNMVLQRDLSNPIWGTATSGATITLVLDTETPITTIVDSSGKWKATLPSHPHDGGLSHTLNITSPQANPLSFNNVVFGDVYLASGQSNMARTVNSDNVFNADAEIAAAEYPLIRSVTLEAVPFPTTLSGLVSAPLDNPVISYNWTPCSPTSVVNFSGTGYFFARKIFQETGIPIGIIACAVGGRPIEEFIAPDGIASVPDLSGWRQEIADCLISKPLKYGRYCWRFFSMIGPISTYGIRGTIWYQGGGGHSRKRFIPNENESVDRRLEKSLGSGRLPILFCSIVCH